MNEVWHARTGIVARGQSGPGGENLPASTWQRLEALPDPRLPRGGSTRWPEHAGYLYIPEGRRDHTTPAEARRLHGLD